MTERLSIIPDEVSVAGSRRADPPRPVEHAWQLTCRLPGLRVDEQIAELMDRMLPSQATTTLVPPDLALHDPPA